MSTKTADLHIHTYYSDSTLSPFDVVKAAYDCGLAAVGITDHDTMEGIEPARMAAKDYGLEVVPGVELSTEIDGNDIHILGYFINYHHGRLQQELTDMRDVRVKRIKQMIEKLRDEGINNIEPQEVISLTKSNAVGRLHLATVLKEKGWVSSINEAFDRFIGEGCPAYVPKLKRTPPEAIELIKESGGVAVLAHPMVNNKDELIPSLAKAGLGGIEVYYPGASETEVRFYEGIAKKHNLIATGGSDAHGDGKNNTFIGKVSVPLDVVRQLKELSGN